MSNKNKIVEIIENAIEDFGSKWSKILQLEFPDRESELIEMLKGIQNDFKSGYSLTDYDVEKIDSLIQSVKQP